MDNNKDKFEESTMPTGDIESRFAEYRQKKLAKEGIPESPSVLREKIFNQDVKNSLLKEMEEERAKKADGEQNAEAEQQKIASLDIDETKAGTDKVIETKTVDDGQVEIILPEIKPPTGPLENTDVHELIESKDPHSTQPFEGKDLEQYLEETKADDAEILAKVLEKEKGERLPASDDSTFEVIEDNEGVVIDMDGDDEVIERPSIMNVIASDNEEDVDGSHIGMTDEEKDSLSIISLPMETDLEPEDIEKYQRKEFGDPEELDDIFKIPNIEKFTDEEKNILRIAKLRSLPVEEQDDLLGLHFNKFVSEDARKVFRQKKINEKFGLSEKPKNGTPYGESESTISVKIADLGEEMDEKDKVKMLESADRAERMKMYRTILQTAKDLENGLKGGKDKDNDNDYGAIKLALLKVFAQVQDEVANNDNSYSEMEQPEEPVDLNKKYADLHIGNIKQKILELYSNDADQEEILQALEKEVGQVWWEEAGEKINQWKSVKWSGLVPLVGPVYRWAKQREMKNCLQAEFADKKDKLVEHYDLTAAATAEESDFMHDLNEYLKIFSNFSRSENEVLLRIAERLKKDQASELFFVEDIKQPNQLQSVLDTIEKYTEQYVGEKLKIDRNKEQAADLTDDQIDKIAKLTSVCAGLTAEKNYHIKKNAVKDSWYQRHIVSRARWLDKMWFGKDSFATALTTGVATSGIALYAARKTMYAVGLGGVAGAWAVERAFRNVKALNFRKKSAELVGMDKVDKRLEEIRSHNIYYKNEFDRQDVVISNEAQMLNSQLEKALKENVGKPKFDVTGWRQDKVKLDGQMRENMSRIKTERRKRDVYRWGLSAIIGVGAYFGLHKLAELWHGDVDHPLPDHPDTTPSAVPSEVVGETPGDGGGEFIGDVTPEPEVTTAVGGVETALPEDTVVPTMTPDHEVIPGMTPKPESTFHATSVPETTAAPELTVQAIETPSAVITPQPEVTVTPETVVTPTIAVEAQPEIITEQDFSDWLQGEAVVDAPDTHEETIENIKNLYLSQSQQLSPERVVQYCDAMHIDCPEAVQKFVENHVDEFGNNADGYEKLRLLLNNTHVVTDADMKMDDLLEVLKYREDTIGHMAGLFDDSGKLNLDLVADYCHNYGDTHVNPLNFSTDDIYDDIYIDTDIKNWLGETVKSDAGQKFFSHDYNGHRHLRWILNNTNIISDDLTPQQVVRVAQVLERAGIKGTLLEKLGSAGKHELVQKILDNWSAIWARPELLRAVEGDVTNGSQMITDYIYKYGQDWTKFKAGYKL